MPNIVHPTTDRARRGMAVPFVGAAGSRYSVAAKRPTAGRAPCRGEPAHPTHQVASDMVYIDGYQISGLFVPRGPRVHQTAPSAI